MAEQEPEADPPLFHLLFTPQEVRRIIRLRKIFEKEVKKPEKNKDHVYNYIKTEFRYLGLAETINEQEELGNRSQMSELLESLSERVERAYKLGMRWFPLEVNMELDYYKFCMVWRESEASEVLEQLLERHGRSHPELFVSVADWTVKKLENVKEAQEILLKGLSNHPGCKLILQKAFQLALVSAENKRKRCEAYSIPIDPTNSILTAQAAELLYELEIKPLQDVEFLSDLLNICGKYDFASSLESRIQTDMLAEFETNPRMWDIMAKRELKAKANQTLTAKERIRKCVEVYERGVEKVSIAAMWGHYIDTLLQLITNSPVLPKFKRDLLDTAMCNAAKKEQLAEKYFLIWTTYLQGPGRKKDLEIVLAVAVMSYPQSSALRQQHMALLAQDKAGQEVAALVM